MVYDLKNLCVSEFAKKMLDAISNTEDAIGWQRG